MLRLKVMFHASCFTVSLVNLVNGDEDDGLKTISSPASLPQAKASPSCLLHNSSSIDVKCWPYHAYEIITKGKANIHENEA